MVNLFEIQKWGMVASRTVCCFEYHGDICKWSVRGVLVLSSGLMIHPELYYRQESASFCLCSKRKEERCEQDDDESQRV